MQVFYLLWHTFGHCPENFTLLAYDRACGLRPYLVDMRGTARRELPNTQELYERTNIMLENWEFMIDRFHAKGHKRP